MKTNLQKHEKLIFTLESKFDQMQLVYEEEQQRNSDVMEEMKTQMMQLASTSLDNNQKFDELIDLIKKNLKGKTVSSPEVGSTNQKAKPSII